MISSSERFTVGIDLGAVSERGGVVRVRDAGVGYAGFAEMARTGLAVIDESMAVADYQRELRWNAAHHRPAQDFCRREPR